MLCLSTIDNLRSNATWKNEDPFDYANGRPFCSCYEDKKNSANCQCGEEETQFDWTWDNEAHTRTTVLSNGGRDILFHSEYSSGTASGRGSRPFVKGLHHYWEVKMTAPVYGTDMMIGVCTSEANLFNHNYRFCSLIGIDSESWGLSYTGFLQHQQSKRPYAPRFGQGAIIGVHLDMCHGSLEFYLNRKPLGIAFYHLQNAVLYPVVSSTAARSGMRLITACSLEDSLTMQSVTQLMRSVPQGCNLLDKVEMPPGLQFMLKKNFWWKIQNRCSTQCPLKKPIMTRLRLVIDDRDETLYRQGWLSYTPLRDVEGQDRKRASSDDGTKRQKRPSYP